MVYRVLLWMVLCSKARTYTQSLLTVFRDSATLCTNILSFHGDLVGKKTQVPWVRKFLIAWHSVRLRGTMYYLGGGRRHCEAALLIMWGYNVPFWGCFVSGLFIQNMDYVQNHIEFMFLVKAVTTTSSYVSSACGARNPKKKRGSHVVIKGIQAS